MYFKQCSRSARQAGHDRPNTVKCVLQGWLRWFAIRYVRDIVGHRAAGTFLFSMRALMRLSLVLAASVCSAREYRCALATSDGKRIAPTATGNRRKATARTAALTDVLSLTSGRRLSQERFDGFTSALTCRSLYRPAPLWPSYSSLFLQPLP